MITHTHTYKQTPVTMLLIGNIKGHCGYCLFTNTSTLKVWFFQTLLQVTMASQNPILVTMDYLRLHSHPTLHHSGFVPFKKWRAHGWAWQRSLLLWDNLCSKSAIESVSYFTSSDTTTTTTSVMERESDMISLSPSLPPSFPLSGKLDGIEIHRIGSIKLLANF